MSIFVVHVILINHYVNFVAGRLVADKVYIILLDYRRVILYMYSFSLKIIYFLNGDVYFKQLLSC